MAVVELRAQIGVLRFQPASFECAVEGMQQLFDLKRLGDKIRGASLDCFDGDLDGAEAGDHDGHDLRVEIDRRFDHGGSVHAGEPQIGHDHIERELGEARQSGLSGTDLLDLIFPARELRRDRLAQQRLILDEQQVFRSIRHFLATRQHVDSWPDPCPASQSCRRALRARD